MFSQIPICLTKRLFLDKSFGQCARPMAVNSEESDGFEVLVSCFQSSLFKVAHKNHKGVAVRDPSSPTLKHYPWMTFKRSTCVT
uniref:Secreted protein n=1 Tax=Steinernema glaseri TaxID=37863 RepID=A0A1I7YXZ2_9BILA